MQIDIRIRIKGSDAILVIEREHELHNMNLSNTQVLKLFATGAVDEMLVDEAQNVEQFIENQREIERLEREAAEIERKLRNARGFTPARPEPHRATSRNPRSALPPLPAIPSTHALRRN